MKDSKVPKSHPPTRGATTAELMLYYEYEKNPVTRSVYRNMTGNRIDEARQKHTYTAL